MGTGILNVGINTSSLGIPKGLRDPEIKPNPLPPAVLFLYWCYEKVGKTWPGDGETLVPALTLQCN